MQYRYQNIECLQKVENVKVTKSRDLQSGKEVCIKRILVSQLENARRLLEEIITLYSLRQYPYFCKIIEYFIKGQANQLEKIYIVTEYYSGGNLCLDIIDKNKLGINYKDNELIEYFTHLLAGFSLMQKLNFFHRDIKPENIFITENKTLLIGDFGGITTSPENNTTIIGSPSYMSPEMRLRFTVLNKQDYIEDIDICKSDVWSLGVTFLFMITAEIPKYLQNLEEIESILVQKFNSIKNKIFKKLLLKMLIVDPNKRWDFCQINDWFLSKINRKVEESIENEYYIIKNPSVNTESLSHIIEKPVLNIENYSINVQRPLLIERRPFSTESQDSISINPTVLIKKIYSQRSIDFTTVPSCETCDLSKDFTYCKKCKYLCHIPCLKNLFYVCPKCQNPLNYSNFEIRCKKCQIIFKGKLVNPNCKHRLCIKCQATKIKCKYCFGFEIMNKSLPKPQSFPEFDTCNKCDQKYKVNGKFLTCENDKISVCVVCKRSKHVQSCILNDDRKHVKCFMCSFAMFKESGSIFVFCTKCNWIYCYVCMKSVDEVSHLNCSKLYCY